jgi:REP element-mobilizing transposase RayT
MDKYQNKYRIPSARLKNWDYGSNGAYFITICTQNREHFFGEIINGQMLLNATGQTAEKFWTEIPEHFPFIELGNFVVMPNHVHGILIIDKPDNGLIVETPKLGVSTGNDSATNKTGGKNENWKPATIGVIINQYKRMVTIQARKSFAGFGWQSRFYDHIIRDAPSFETIQDYISNNPNNWEKDKLHG